MRKNMIFMDNMIGPNHITHLITIFCSLIAPAIKVYQGRDPKLSGVKLQTGNKHDDYKLYVTVRATSESGTFVTVTTHTQVLEDTLIGYSKTYVKIRFSQILVTLKRFEKCTFKCFPYLFIFKSRICSK